MTEILNTFTFTSIIYDYLSAVHFCSTLVTSVVSETIDDALYVYNLASDSPLQMWWDYIWSGPGFSVSGYFNSILMEAIPQNPLYYYDRNVILSIALFSLIVLLYLFHVYVLADPDETHLVRQDRVDLYEHEDEEAEIEEVLQEINNIDPDDPDEKLGAAQSLEMKTLQERYKTLIEQWTDLAKTRHRDGLIVNFSVQIGSDYWKMRGFVFLLMFLTIIFAMLFLRATPIQNWGDRFVSSTMEAALRRACFEEESWADYIERMAGVNSIECEAPDLIYLYAIDFDRYVKDTFSYYLPGYSFDFCARALFVFIFTLLSILIILTIPGWVHFKVDIHNTPLSVDMRPDEMRLLNIRHKDPMMSEVTETRSFMLMIKNFFNIPRTCRYVISYELFCQLSAPNHWAYGMEETAVEEKMSHSAQYFSTINFDRHIYHNTSAFENTVRVAKYRHRSRVLAGMPSF